MDRADEIAREIVANEYFYGDEAFNGTKEADAWAAKIAAALRSYGDERIEAAARTFELGIYGEAYKANLPMDWPRLIRSLKSQPIQDKP